MSHEIVANSDEYMQRAGTVMAKGLADYARQLLQDRQAFKAARVPGTTIDPSVVHTQPTYVGRMASRVLINRKAQHEIGSD
jgi:hypothetical protein